MFAEYPPVRSTVPQNLPLTVPEAAYCLQQRQAPLKSLNYLLFPLSLLLAASWACTWLRLSWAAARCKGLLGACDRPCWWSWQWGCASWLCILLLLLLLVLRGLPGRMVSLAAVLMAGPSLHPSRQAPSLSQTGAGCRGQDVWLTPIWVRGDPAQLELPAPCQLDASEATCSKRLVPQSSCSTIHVACIVSPFDRVAKRLKAHPTPTALHACRNTSSTQTLV